MLTPHQTAVAVGAVADAVRRALAEDRAEDDITTRWAVRTAPAPMRASSPAKTA
ncbi:hypothetical protein ACGFJ5_23600 [Micromonospora echinaurantiaca]|uniref:hypothetical protein n=1 Tax=Micromonospora echinaurantiaca TaxID=47857 RepID=UPI003717BC17